LKDFGYKLQPAEKRAKVWEKKKNLQTRNIPEKQNKKTYNNLRPLQHVVSRAYLAQVELSLMG